MQEKITSKIQQKMSSTIQEKMSSRNFACIPIQEKMVNGIAQLVMKKSKTFSRFNWEEVKDWEVKETEDGLVDLIQTPIGSASNIS